MRWSSTSTRTYGARRVFTRIRFATTRPWCCHMQTSCASLLPPVMRHESSPCARWLRKGRRLDARGDSCTLQHKVLGTTEAEDTDASGCARDATHSHGTADPQRLEDLPQRRAGAEGRDPHDSRGDV